VNPPEDGRLLRIFIGESDKHAGIPLYDWIVKQAREHRLAGATVIRGLEGFGAHGHLHTVKFLGAITEGLTTLEKVEVRFYRSED